MDNQERYIEEHSAAGTEAENALLAELDRVTNLRVIQPKMVAGRVQGAFLRLVADMLRPKTVLEIGTFTGYSALSIAAGLADDAELHTVEIDDELEDLARSFFVRSPHGAKIRLHIGSALEVVPQLARTLGRPFDMIYIDGDKREYLDYYRMVMGDGGAAGVGEGSVPTMVRPGSIILADNVLWYGKVAEFPHAEARMPDEAEVEGGRKGSADRHTAGIVEFNRLVAADPRVENVILPLRDGINMIRVK